jgi:aryl-alcohol dehydrogenase-like predicted oxidoreductase
MAMDLLAFCYRVTAKEPKAAVRCCMTRRVTGTIVGARKPDQVDDVVAAAELHLTKSELMQIETVFDLAGRIQ